ncbi:hypothetical protein H4582DRAFT_2061037 [Lactarius indigo]|nr:hypothetical protein H4582DRAFT_2061037 [Lactarius indigo]
MTRSQSCCTPDEDEERATKGMELGHTCLRIVAARAVCQWSTSVSLDNMGKAEMLADKTVQLQGVLQRGKVQVDLVRVTRMRQREYSTLLLSDRGYPTGTEKRRRVSLVVGHPDRYAHPTTSDCYFMVNPNPIIIYVKSRQPDEKKVGASETEGARGFWDMHIEVEYQDHPEMDKSEKGELRETREQPPLTEVVCQKDLLESTIYESSDAGYHRVALDSGRHLGAVVGREKKSG